MRRPEVSRKTDGGDWEPAGPTHDAAARRRSSWGERRKGGTQEKGVHETREGRGRTPHRSPANVRLERQTREYLPRRRHALSRVVRPVAGTARGRTGTAAPRIETKLAIGLGVGGGLAHAPLAADRTDVRAMLICNRTSTAIHIL